MSNTLITQKIILNKQIIETKTKNVSKSFFTLLDKGLTNINIYYEEIVIGEIIRAVFLTDNHNIQIDILFHLDKIKSFNTTFINSENIFNFIKI